MSGLFFYTEQRHGGPQRRQRRGYRPLSTSVQENSLVSGGLKSSVMNGCGSALVRCQLNRRSDRDVRDGLVTLRANQSTPLHDKNLNLELRGQKEKRTTAKYMTPQSGSKRQRNCIGLYQETAGEIDSGPECLAGSCRRPMLQIGVTKALVD